MSKATDLFWRRKEGEEIRGRTLGIERERVLSLLSSLPSVRRHRQHVGYNGEAYISVHVAPKLAGTCPVCLALVCCYFSISTIHSSI